MRVTRTLLGIAGALLVSFHGWLLASQLLDGQFADPWLAVRWIAALVLAGTLVALGRRGHGVFSRRAVAVWVLAALLHGPAVASHAGEGAYAAVLPESAATLLLQVVASTAAVALVLLLVGFVARTRQDRQGSFPGLAACAFAGPLGGPASLPFSPRPPPAA